MKTNPLNIYIMGICGTGTGALAGLLKQLGHKVSGSDAHVYPPMSHKLRDWGIVCHEGYDAAHLTPKPDLVICGNVIRADNPEAVYVREIGVKTLSMPQAVAQFGIGNKHSIVVAGTHGKTTTSALLTHVLMHAGRDPSYLVGGALVGYTESFRAGTGNVFVVEGDEYDTAYFDKGPKFLHYRAKSAIITSLEFDHADIFADVQAVEAAFRKFVETVPKDGRIIVWHGAERARRVIAEHRKTDDVMVYATSRPAADDAQLYLESFSSGPAGITFVPVLRGKSLGEMRVPLWGDFSACNALAVIAALEDCGLSTDAMRAGLASFAGVRRRMEIRGIAGGVTVVDDFAHHPTAVSVTLAAARTRWPQKRIWAIFEPRSATSRRNVFQAAYAKAFSAADEVIIAGHARLEEVAKAQRFDPDALAQAITDGGKRGHFIKEPADIAEFVAKKARDGDVVMVLSNGDFGGLHKKLIEVLGGRQAPPRQAPQTPRP